MRFDCLTDGLIDWLIDKFKFSRNDGKSIFELEKFEKYFIDK